MLTWLPSLSMLFPLLLHADPAQGHLRPAQPSRAGPGGKQIGIPGHGDQ